MRRTSIRLSLLCLTAMLPTAAAWAAPVPVVVELFTSQSCSSCPPADALLAELRRTRPELLPLDFHVDYWNHLGWKDPYSSAAATDRQRRYAAALGSDVYTPQVVVAGASQVIGSDRDAVLAAIATAEAAASSHPVTLGLAVHGAALTIDVGAGQGSGELVLVGFDGEHTTRIGNGENGGLVLTEVNVVRSLRRLGGWNGAPLQFQTQAPAGQHAALLLADPSSGHILAAALADTASGPVLATK